MSPQDPAPVPDRLGPPVPIPADPADPAARAAHRRRIAWLCVGAVGAAAAVAGGMWAWQAWSEQGAQPAEALPADTLAYVALDFDPPGQQKAAALGSLRKFPTASKELGLDSADALLRSLVEEVASEADCELDYATHVKPWVGDRVAFAVVSQDRPEPVVVLQVEDADAAGSGLDAVDSACADLPLGHATEDGWAVLARTDEVAARVLADAGDSSLADDSDFRALVDAAGDPGVATVFLAPAAGQALLDAIADEPFLAFTALPMVQTSIDPLSGLFMAAGFWGMTVVDGPESWDEAELEARPRTPEEEALDEEFERFEELTPAEQTELLKRSEKLFRELHGPDPFDEAGEYDDLDCRGEGEHEECFGPSPQVTPTLRAALADFTGLGGVARFEGGALEVELVTDRLAGSTREIYRGGNAAGTVSSLPSGSAITLGAGLAEGWVQALLTATAQQAFLYGAPGESGEPDEDAVVAGIERATGLDLPQDLEALGGSGFSLVVAGGFDPETLFDDPAHARVALHVVGDAATIEKALDKVRTKVDASLVQSRRVGDGVVIGPDPDYLDELAAGGSRLGDSKRFTGVLPDVSGADSVMFLDFDAGDWLVNSLGEGQRADAAPMDTLGMSVTPEGDRDRIRLRLTFD